LIELISSSISDDLLGNFWNFKIRISISQTAAAHPAASYGVFNKIKSLYTENDFEQSKNKGPLRPYIGLLHPGGHKGPLILVVWH
jgi:hypothetical protein